MKAAVSLPHSRFTYYDSIFRLFLITYNNTATPTIPATGTAMAVVSPVFTLSFLCEMYQKFPVVRNLPKCPDSDPFYLLLRSLYPCM